MWVASLKCKIHRARVTDANLEYEGSITIGRELMDSAGLRPFEKVHIYNVTNGERFETYAIEGSKGTICLNGAAAWKARPNDVIIIVSYCWLSEEEAGTYQPRLVFVDGDNGIKSVHTGGAAH